MVVVVVVVELYIGSQRVRTPSLGLFDQPKLFSHTQIDGKRCQGLGRGGEETRSGTEKRCSHNLQSGHPAWWSADNCSIFPTVDIFALFRSKKRTGRGNQKCLKN